MDAQQPADSAPAPTVIEPSPDVSALGERAAHLRQVLNVTPGQTVRVGLIDGPLGEGSVRAVGEGSVELRCETRGERERIEVRDTGVGIPPEQLGLIFEEFYQVGVPPNSSRDGYGLGLSIEWQRSAIGIGLGRQDERRPRPVGVRPVRMRVCVRRVDPQRAVGLTADRPRQVDATEVRALPVRVDCDPLLVEGRRTVEGGRRARASRRHSIFRRVEP